MIIEKTKATGHPCTVSGIGVISGQTVNVEISQAAPGHGIVFYQPNQPPLPASLDSVIHLDRGVTLGSSFEKGSTEEKLHTLSPQPLSIVEHFLCAAAFAGLSDLAVQVEGAAELPILDGSAQDWFHILNQHFNTHLNTSETIAVSETGIPKTLPQVSLQHAVFYRHNPDIVLYAIPDTHFKITYGVDFNHPDLTSRWARWDSQTDEASLVLKACTFGYISELPALKARGLALGASLDNALGLIEAGGYSRDLRHTDEPIYHKMLDLIGDLSLIGINPLTFKTHIFALNAGHSSHIPFAEKLKKALC